jgi:membrane-associated phospholipid phosphatase
MSDQEELLSKNALMIIGVISVIIFVVGMILLALGYNEAFYVKDPSVRAIFEIITFMGETEFFLILLITIYVVYDKKFAKNVTFSLLLSVYIYTLLKDLFQDPRPITNISKEAEYGYIETDYGFPSGHAVTAVTVWGYIANEFKNRPRSYIIPVILSVIIFLITISRVIIGVHDLEDIIGGFLIGICFLIAFIYLEPIFSEKINSLNFSIKIIIAVSFSVLIFLIGTLLFPRSGLDLIENPPLYSDAGYYAVVSGAILGFSVGYLLENKYINYQPSELNNKHKIINLILGIFFIFTLYFMFGLLIHGNVILRFIRYSLITFIVSFILPLIFTKINRKQDLST